MMRHYERGRGSSLAPGLPCYGAQRLAVQVIEVRMGDEDEVCRRQVAQVQSGLAQTLEHKEPAGKIRIDDDILSADLQEETRMSDEGDAELAISDEGGFVRLAGTRCDRGMPHQASELAGTLAQSPIF